jgi:SpoIID/LytB domain protein
MAVAARYADVGPVTDIEILERAPSGRVARLRVVGVDGETVVERELNIRRTFGGLRSALFVMDIEHAADGIIASVRFDGGGFGHGVGLCQSGAIGGAERGFGHDAILARYYPDTTLRTLY